ncbi:hypothetical protein EYF80_027860 [Liparis tanakae]|uniref:Uncharacterized protein n=1 Tax=Liparis tanakae TaxID=230148 RepID=A0A4Z2HA95_9TELE|nr:hypothetical protein EYF80_027860 [Liparis tanakae]
MPSAQIRVIIVSGEPHFHQGLINFFHRTHIDAEKAGCECVSESFPDEGDKGNLFSFPTRQIPPSLTRPKVRRQGYYLEHHSLKHRGLGQAVFDELKRWQKL